MTLDRAQRRVLLLHPAGWIACGFGSGLSPVAPGTAGSLAAVLPWLALRELPPVYFAAAIAAAFALGIRVCGWTVRKLNVADPSAVVWDEFVGQWIALAPLVLWPRGWAWVAVGFVLFRLYDIAKPWPASWADRALGGGLGVMLDDVIAGVYSAMTLGLLLRFA